ncbi:MAG: esterase family protein [Acidobacteria bacterium]|nr:esterase family protein [Acidobacteriota bacterium]
MNNLEKNTHSPEQVSAFEKREGVKKFLLKGLLALLLSLSFAAAARAQTHATAPVPSAAAQQQPSSRVRTIQFESKLVGRTLPYLVLLPKDYDAPASKALRYPVIYLLHGFGGGPGHWFTPRMNLVQAAEQYPFILVALTDNNHWYTDSASVPADKYETYIFEELIPDVQKRFRAVEAREGRGVAGLSMGGYGALKLGVKHPDVFAFAASMSGALGIATWDEAELHVPAILASARQTFGPLDGPVRQSNDLFKLVRELPAARVASLPFLYLDCGTEDFFKLLPVNRSMTDLLIERKIPHEYRERPGDHNMAYWGHQSPELLRVAAEKLKLPSPLPPQRGH